MVFTFIRASNAMLVTSSTTAAAFIATSFSEIMPISTFGVFSAILVPINYLLVIVMFPAVIVIYERYIKFKFCLCLNGMKCCFREVRKDDPDFIAQVNNWMEKTTDSLNETTDGEYKTHKYKKVY